LSAGVIGHALAAWLTLPVPFFPVLLVVMGLGMGLATSTSSVLTLALSSAAEHGQASTSLNLADVLGSVTVIAAGGAVFAALHVAAGQDATVFALIWAIVAVGAVLLVIAGRRIRTRG
ncbi:MAG: MFS transporter, partial [Intrasporangiaceae bacterium]|nr:MFS transporter [Intrasporangiaceae bacterium]